MNFDQERGFGVEIETHNETRDFAMFDIPHAIEMLRADGYEVQRYENGAQRPPNHWAVTRDAGIPGPEIVSPILRGTAGLDEVVRMFDTLNEHEVQVTERCGLHVHHDATDFRNDHFVRLAALWAEFQPGIVQIVQANRLANPRFAAPMMHRHEILQAARLVRANRLPNLPQLMEFLRVPVTHRTAVNFDAYERHGTVEFRVHHGTMDAAEARAWIVVTNALMTAAKTKPLRRQKRDQRPYEDIEWERFTQWLRSGDEPDPELVGAMHQLENERRQQLPAIRELGVLTRHGQGWGGDF